MFLLLLWLICGVVGLSIFVRLEGLRKREYGFVFFCVLGGPVFLIVAVLYAFERAAKFVDRM